MRIVYIRIPQATRETLLQYNKHYPKSRGKGLDVPKDDMKAESRNERDNWWDWCSDSPVVCTRDISQNIGIKNLFHTERS